MVYCGKPSRGCENCRKHHKKCDEKRPACSRCLKLKRTCLGYRDQIDLIFRDETSQVQARSRQRRACTGTSSNCIRLHTSSWSHAFADVLQLPITLSPSMEDTVVSHFYHTTLETISDEDPVHFLHSQLPSLYARGSPKSALRLATEAISYAASRQYIRQGALVARERYVKAVKAIRQAVQDPVEAQDPAVLYAILLLSGFETMIGDLESPLAWGTHLDGAAAVARIQVASHGNSALSRGIFGFILKGTVLIHMQSCQPMGETSVLFNATATTSHQNPEGALFSLAAKIPNLQHKSSHILARSPAVEQSHVQRLLQCARRIDQDLLDWADAVRETWPYIVAVDIDQLSDLSYTPREIHRYPSFYTARVWNCYRVSRLIVQSILHRANVRLSTFEGASNNAHHEIEESEEQSNMLVNDICASVPFLLGNDLSRMKLLSPTSIVAAIEAKNREHAPATGRFSLILPLRVACSASSVPRAQKEWIHLQLQLMAECGEPQARLAGLTGSQILRGGSDSIRFDCV
ncbi:C6 zinc finger protein [Microdochium trichocladiopsis]|uniref:C6 zinc finger protein n=1 Tax=Microdochium trichocladiopsis TaxID=1682393 RepID=A0A9P9BJV0_9PEZI|nr:C6 zinc finger protein [Microdochium trichocladiopsis]KAH7016389.1 C6 zinc finger protein [Microdochium trichocladiopsis]